MLTTPSHLPPPTPPTPSPGTGTVVVRVGDVNDVAPKFTQAAYQIAVGETDDTSRVLATLPIIDPDLTNNLAFRVSEIKSPSVQVSCMTLNYSKLICIPSSPTNSRLHGKCQLLLVMIFVSWCTLKKMKKNP